MRKAIWDYPLEAIREAVINALIHRDYLSTAEIQIRLYDDKIWIWNPGKLPPQINVEDLKKEHSSYPRNPLIANVFYLSGFIERWGSGTKRWLNYVRNRDYQSQNIEKNKADFPFIFSKISIQKKI